MRCPFGYEVGDPNGPWHCPLSHASGKHDCHCTDCALMFAMGEIDDTIQTVVEFWRAVYQQAEHAWTPNIPNLPIEWR